MAKAAGEAEVAGSEFRRGWPRVACAFLGNSIGVHTLPPYTLGLFIVPLQQEFGWSRTSIAAGIAISTLCTAFSSPIVGILLNRLSERLLVPSGLAVGSIAYFALAAMDNSLGGYWTIMALMALFGCGCATVTLSHLVVSTFERHRGAALGISMMGIGMSGALAPVFLGPVIEDYGWRAAYMSIGLVLACAVPVSFLLLSLNREIPTTSKASSATSPQLFNDPLFLRLLLTFFLIAIAVGGVVVHFVPMLVDAGYSARQASGLASILGISLMLGRLLTGVVIDRVFAPKVAATLMVSSAVGFIILFLGQPGWIPFAAVLVGLSLGAELDLVAYLVSKYFPRDLYGRIVGLLYSGFLVGVALSPVLFAEVRDQLGSYSLGLLWAAALLSVSGGIFLTLPRFPNPFMATLINIGATRHGTLSNRAS